MTERLDWTDYFLQIADAVAARADCTRRKVGAVVVDAQTKHLIATGYNGAAPGEPGCLSDGACPRGRHYKQFIASGAYICGGCKLPWPCAMAVAPSSSYDTGPGACIALHAEANSLLRAGQQARGNWIFCTDKPCDGCQRLIKGAGIKLAVWCGGAWHPSGQPEKSWLKRLLRK